MLRQVLLSRRGRDKERDKGKGKKRKLAKRPGWERGPKAHGPPPVQNASTLTSLIGAYDAALGAYRAFGIANVQAASLYHPYYLCLGTSCSGAFEPPACEMGPTFAGGKTHWGIGHTVDGLRMVSSEGR